MVGFRKPRKVRPKEKNVPKGYDSKWEHTLHTTILQEWEHHTNKVPYIVEHKYEPDFVKVIGDKEIIKQMQRYVDGTYEQHYAYGEYQATDIIFDNGHGEGFCMGNIIKYAMRYGKKNGHDQKDLLKIIHYAMMAIHLQDTTDD